MSSKVISIAVGSSGSATGHGVLRALAASSLAPHLIACDTNPRHLVAAGSQFDFRQIPLAASESFVAELLPVLRDAGATAFYPIHDVEIAACSAAHDAFSTEDVQVLAPPAEAVAMVRDKLGLFEAFDAARVPCPETTRLDRAEWAGARLHYKPRSGVGSHGVGVLSDADALRRRQAQTDAATMIVQPFIAGQEITIDMFCPAPGDVFAYCCRERIDVKAGVSNKARLFLDPVLGDLGARVSATTGLTGAFCFQVRGEFDSGAWKVIDVNPRVGGGTPMCVAVGLDFPSAHVAHHLGRDPAPYFRPLPQDDVYVTRSFVEHVAWPKDPS
ncbi:ATP-grasp domain-containing protein [Roseovarius aestuariivivens]|uniref:ATP-grasp domain-containing protein n=1 Tax=Roseovarius aestuariivivens TaxID=1888910 RepID=UPI00108219FE|nr:ATP-grasp domain-containing protein [Roseovarius aestuariivivens]